MPSTKAGKPYVIDFKAQIFKLTRRAFAGMTRWHDGVGGADQVAADLAFAWVSRRSKSGRSLDAVHLQKCVKTRAGKAGDAAGLLNAHAGLGHESL
jgi:hypothetical protein